MNVKAPATMAMASTSWLEARYRPAAPLDLLPPEGDAPEAPVACAEPGAPDERVTGVVPGKITKIVHEQQKSDTR